MTLFYPEIQYDIPMISRIMDAIANNFNIVMAKDQFV